MGTLTNLSKTQLSQEQNSYTSFCFLSHEVKWHQKQDYSTWDLIFLLQLCVYIFLLLDTKKQRFEI